MKTCITCKADKDLDCFANNKSTKDGKHHQCKACNKLQSAKYREQNKDKIKAKRKIDYKVNIQIERSRSHQYYKQNKDKKQLQNKTWRENNPDKVKQIHEDWYLKNRVKKLKYNADYEKQQMLINSLYRLKKNLRTRIPNALNGKVKTAKTMELLGCTIQELRVYLEKQFDKFMNWENYGSYWHVDHIKPCSLFDLSDSLQQRECFHFTNLQPLEAKENLKKYNKY